MGKIRNRKEALYKRNQVNKLFDKVLTSGDNCDEFGKLEEIVIEDDYCMYQIGKYSELSKYYNDDADEYSKEYGNENPLVSCFEEIISYLDKIIIGDFEDRIKSENIGEGGIVEVNGLNFHPVSRVEVMNRDGESFVYLCDGTDLIAKIPFLDIVSYKIISSQEDDFI